MPQVVQLFWRAMTAADFFNIERSRDRAPVGGGGQTYISVSFRGLGHAELGSFLGITPPTEVKSSRPKKVLKDVAVAYEPTVTADLTFSPRYQPPQTDDRYRIATQNRQYPNQLRHPAWTVDYGFPKAPDDISSSQDPRMPDLSFLKVWVARLADGTYSAGYSNAPNVPANLLSTPPIHVLFEPYDESNSAGVIDLRSLNVDLADLLGTVSPDQSIARQAPEVLEALDATRRASGRRPSGQGLRASAPERQAIEARAVAVATAALKADDWRVEDVGLYRSYDLHCSRNNAVKRVEVKGTTGDGSGILLTPNEVAHARENPNVALMIVYGIALETNAGGEITGSCGTLKVIDPWSIDQHGTLRPTGYAYWLV